jgi:CRISPR-associated protein Csm1
LQNNQQLINEETQRRLSADLEEYEPAYSGGIIEFSFLAGFSKIRTGTKKIGILKMDVDGLGTLFGLLDSLEVAGKISQTISNFFSGKLNDILKTTITNNQQKNTPSIFGQNIYTVFAGGDDCFFVGSWDVIMEWAALVQHEFKIISDELASWIINLKGRSNTPIALLDILPITISAGLVMLEPTYPTIRFSDLTNKALDDAKYFTYPREPKQSNTKDKISLLGQVLTWEEFATVRSAAALLEQLIKEKGEPKSTIEKIRSTAPEFHDLYKKASRNIIQGPSVAKLFYFTRKSPNQATISKAFITPFAKDLISIFVLGNHSNPLKYPLAARIAEFYTRKQTS